MQNRAMSSEEICRKYIERINRVDKNRLNSVIEINPDALEIAEKLDRERKDGKIRGALHGIPVLIKDNIDTADKMLTTAGSLALLDNYAKKDASIVAQMRAAGAVILGKTNLSEWANFRSTNATSGWSGRGGQTNNPYNLARNPCGSSSGTGAAISANLAAVGIGTETDGSIVCPANNCGLVGLKPTVGRVSRAGIIPISASQDTAGPMTRTVADAAVLLNYLAAFDIRDSATARNKERVSIDYTSYLRADGLRGGRIGVLRQYTGKNDKVDAVFEDSIKALKAAGANIFDVKLPTFGKFGDAEFEVLLYEFKDGLHKYLATATTKYKTLDQLIAFNEAEKAREMPHFGQEIFLQANKKGSLTDRTYRLALQKGQMLSRGQGIDFVIKQQNLDVLIAPTGGAAWMTDLINGDCGSAYFGSSSLAAISGYPSITVPAGFIGEMPCGISFIGRAYDEGNLIKFAYALEQQTKARRKPQI